jgi:hypothetical protein
LRLLYRYLTIQAAHGQKPLVPCERELLPLIWGVIFAIDFTAIDADAQPHNYVPQSIVWMLGFTFVLANLQI